jgi:hypothetical protein
VGITYGTSSAGRRSLSRGIVEGVPHPRKWNAASARPYRAGREARFPRGAGLPINPPMKRVPRPKRDSSLSGPGGPALVPARRHLSGCRLVWCWSDAGPGGRDASGGWEGASDRTRGEMVLNRVLRVCGRWRTARRSGLRPSPTSASRRRRPARTAGVHPPSPGERRIARRAGGPGMLGGSSCVRSWGRRALQAWAGLSAAAGRGLGCAGAGLGVVGRVLMLGTSEPMRIAPAAKMAAATQNAVV